MSVQLAQSLTMQTIQRAKYRYYVYADKCVECVGHNDQPACASACPTDGCIVWSEIASGQPSRDNIGSDMRDGTTPVFA